MDATNTMTSTTQLPTTASWAEEFAELLKPHFPETSMLWATLQTVAKCGTRLEKLGFTPSFEPPVLDLKQIDSVLNSLFSAASTMYAQGRRLGNPHGVRYGSLMHKAIDLLAAPDRCSTRQT
jgi:hypothetical protein